MEPDRKVIKQYFWNNDFHLAQINDDNSFMTLYYEDNKNKSRIKHPKFKDKSEWTLEEKHIASYLKKQNKKFLTRAEVNSWTDIKISNLSSAPANWTLTISLAVSGILTFGIIIFWLVKKRKKK